MGKQKEYKNIHWESRFGAIQLGEAYQEDTKKFLHEIKLKENDVYVSVSLDEEPED